MRQALHPTLIFVTFLTCASLGWAQTPAPVRAEANAAQKTGSATSGQPPSSTNQLIERIQVEDSGTRIDELRFGGETRSIAVVPKGGMPAYDVQPVTGARTWKVFGF